MSIYRAQKWLEFVCIKKVCSYQRICSDHFEEKCFKKIYPRRLLWNNVIPTIRNVSPSENSLEEDMISNTCKKIKFIKYNIYHKHANSQNIQSIFLFQVS